jgi:hypothetical protein
LGPGPTWDARRSLPDVTGIFASGRNLTNGIYEMVGSGATDSEQQIRSCPVPPSGRESELNEGSLPEVEPRIAIETRGESRNTECELDAYLGRF